VNTKKTITRPVGVLAALGLAGGLALAGGGAAGAAGLPSASVANNTLTITGSGGGDSITLAIAADNPNTVLVDFGNGTLPQSFDRTTFSAITANLGRGDDVFAVQPGSVFPEDELTVNGEGGNDTITGGAGDEILSGGAGDDTIRGGAGDDVIFGNGGDDDVDGGIGADIEVLGAGYDTAAWNPGEGSDVVKGGDGLDTLQFNGSNIGEKMSLTANGGQAVLTRDVGAIRMDLDGVEQVNVRAIGGADSIAVNDLSGTDVTDVALDLAATQGGGDLSVDTVTVTGTNRGDAVDVGATGSTVKVTGLHTTTEIAGAEPTDQLDVNTVGGNDTVAVSDAAKALIAVAVDLGIGQR
jgi:RTX calcium-binding nonapeptide repeat (4 copies)